jgi:hypothetical protein
MFACECVLRYRKDFNIPHILFTGCTVGVYHHKTYYPCVALHSHVGGETLPLGDPPPPLGWREVGGSCGDVFIKAIYKVVWGCGAGGGLWGVDGCGICPGCSPVAKPYGHS